MAGEARDNIHRKGIALLEKYKVSGEACSGQATGKIKSVISELIEYVATENQSDSMVEKMYLSGSKDLHTSFVFNFADISLKKGCLDNADKAYRNIIQFYIGGSYAGIRDRAKLGIDDVREARKTSQ